METQNMSIINYDKMNVKKPSSMLVQEIKQLEEQKESTKSVLEKMKLEAQITKLRLQLSGQ